jgi:hypothetical protein
VVAVNPPLSGKPDRPVPGAGKLMTAVVVLAASGVVAVANTGADTPRADAPAAPRSQPARVPAGADGGTVPTVPPAPGVGPQWQPPISGGTRIDGPGTTIGEGTTAGIPASVLAAYRGAAGALGSAEPGCRLPVALLAGIGKVESGHARGGRVDAGGTMLQPILGPVLDGAAGTAAIRDTDGGALDGDQVWDRAVGPMQFIPSTWRGWASDGNGDGRADPENVYDASLAAGRYLCAGGRDLSTDAGIDAAILSYNNSTSYLQLVRSWMAAYSGDVVEVADSTGPAGTPGSVGIPGSPGAPGSVVALPAPPAPTVGPPTTVITPAPPTSGTPAPPGTTTSAPPPPPPTSSTPAPAGSLPVVGPLLCGVGGVLGGLLGALGGLLGSPSTPTPDPNCPP